MKVKEIIKLIETRGWVHVRTAGSHRQFKHPNSSNAVTVPGQLSATLDKGTENDILKKAGLK